MSAAFPRTFNGEAPITSRRRFVALRRPHESRAHLLRNARSVPGAFLRGFRRTVTFVLLVAVVGGCASRHGRPSVRGLPMCPERYPTDGHVIAAPMRGESATMVRPGAREARVCSYGQRGVGATARLGLQSVMVVNEGVAAQWIADFNSVPEAVRSHRAKTPMLCGLDDFDRKVIYFAYPDGSPRAVLATTSGCLGLSNGVRHTALSPAIERDLGLFPAARVRATGAAKPLERVRTR